MPDPKDFVPRLTKDGIYGAPYWYTRTNPFYPTFQMPNCTCYAWGRFWEESGIDNVPHLPTGNAGLWFGRAAAAGYETGDTPQLGAVLCMGKYGGAGHVAIVEQIGTNGDIVCSNSGYSRPVSVNSRSYFFMTNNPKSSNYVTWKNYYFQGFIYNPLAGGGEPVDPDDPYPPQPDPNRLKRFNPAYHGLKNFYKKSYFILRR